MPTYEFSEIQVPNNELDDLPSSRGLWANGWQFDIDFEDVQNTAERVLTPKQYTVFVLRSAGFTYKEIAEIDGTSHVNIKRCYKLMIKKLKKHYK